MILRAVFVIIKEEATLSFSLRKAGKETSVNINKITSEAGEAWKSYKKKDPIMVKKTFAMKDVMYRKSSPGREIWHTEVSFDYDFYLLVFAIIAAAAAVSILMCRMMNGVKSAVGGSRKGKRA